MTGSQVGAFPFFLSPYHVLHFGLFLNRVNGTVWVLVLLNNHNPVTGGIDRAGVKVTRLYLIRTVVTEMYLVSKALIIP